MFAFMMPSQKTAFALAALFVIASVVAIFIWVRQNSNRIFGDNLADDTVGDQPSAREEKPNFVTAMLKRLRMGVENQRRRHSRRNFTDSPPSLPRRRGARGQERKWRNITKSRRQLSNLANATSLRSQHHSGRGSELLSSAVDSWSDRHSEGGNSSSTPFSTVLGSTDSEAGSEEHIAA